jgi:hypothetical protein
MKLDLSRRPARASGLPAGLAAVVAAASFLAFPAAAEAQQTVVVVNQGESRGDHRGPNWMLLSSGLIVLGGTYTASLIVAGTSGHEGDKFLYAPLVGPWVDIATRCSVACTNDTGRKVLLGFDGAFQAIGAVAILGSFLFPGRPGGVVARRAAARELLVLPASYGHGSPGMAVVGTF